MALLPLTMSSPFALPVLIALCVLAYVIYQFYFHPLASIPGPFGANLSRLWIIQASRSGRFQEIMLEMHDKYGDLVRISPNEVSVSDAGAVKTIYGAGSKFRKSDWYSPIQGHRKFDLFGERNEKIHGSQRRLVSRAYAMETLKDLEPYVNDTIKSFLDHMEQRHGQIVDLGLWLQLFAFDVIGEVTFSKSFGFMDAGKDDGTFDQIKRVAKSGAWVGQIPALFWVHDALTPYIGNHLGVTARNGSLRDFTLGVVTDRKQRTSDRKDILSKLFATNKEKPTELDDSGVLSMATTNVVAGSDTTAISARAIVYYLLKNPKYKQRLVEELDALRRQGKLSDPITLDEADHIPYLQAVLYEGNRLHPVFGMNMPRVTPIGGARVSGRYLPAGTVVGANPWVIHRKEDIFGPEVQEFRPERWLEKDAGDKHRLFMSFGAGSRMCLGRNIAWMEISKLIPTLFLHYDIELADPQADWQIDCTVFVFQRGLNVRLTPRLDTKI